MIAMKILSIVSFQKKFRKTLASVIRLDNGEEIRLEPDTILEMNLHSGDEISNERLNSIKSEDEKRKCIAKALRLLAVRPRSEFEIKQGLQREKFSFLAVDASLAYLHEKGYLNDDQFAFQWAKSRLKKKPMGAVSLKFELKRKGIQDEQIRRVLEQLFTDDSEFEKAMIAGRKKITAYKKMDKIKMRQKMYLFLSQRGFAPDIIKRVTKELIE